jgi:hypothetical protein
MNGQQLTSTSKKGSNLTSLPPKSIRLVDHENRKNLTVFHLGKC